MTTITEQMVTTTDSGLRVTDASSIGLRPGEWPGQLDTELGNGQPFLRKRWEQHEGEVLCVEYWQAFGTLRLRVFND